MALIVVLALISMTLGVSYALVRTQTAGVKVATNGRLRNAARQAALTGLSAGMRRISQTSWGGVGSTITGNVTTSDTYSVTYTAGDPDLGPSDPDAADEPYRVTLTAKGFAVDPTASSATTTYEIEQVVRLVPKQLAANPTMWNTMLGYVFYQTHAENLSVEIPLQIQGAMRWQGGLTTFCNEYPTTHSQRKKFLADLNAMRTNGYPDCRPFTGPIVMPTSATGVTNRGYLSDELGLTLTNSAAVTTTSWNHPGSMTTYKLFPGGPSYTVPTLDATVTNTTCQANAETNPAGLFYRNGDLTLGNNTTVVGTLIVSGNVTLSGTNVSIQPHSLSPLTGTTAIPQLPAIVASSQVRVASGANATVLGTVAAFDAFVSQGGTQNTRFDLKGNLVARNLDVQKRTEWDLGSFWWSLIWSFFNDQSEVAYLPVYCQAAANMQYTPQLTIAGPTGSVTRSWLSADTPVYAVGSGDAGLVWSVVRITEKH
jgi:hypothetical protein